MGNALQACCAQDAPLDSKLKVDQATIIESRGSGNGNYALPDDWTDTSLDQTAGDSSVAEDGFMRSGTKGPSFRTMTKQDYLLLYDGIHSLLKERKIGKEQENELYELIGQQDKKLAAAYCKFRDTGQVDALLEPLTRTRGLGRR